MSLSSCVALPCARVSFVVLADAEPGLLPRLLAPLARRDLIPDRVSSRRFGDDLWVEIGLDAAPEDSVRLVEGNLRQVVGVRSVSRSEALARAA